MRRSRLRIHQALGDKGERFDSAPSNSPSQWGSAQVVDRHDLGFAGHPDPTPVSLSRIADLDDRSEDLVAHHHRRLAGVLIRHMDIGARRHR